MLQHLGAEDRIDALIGEGQLQRIGAEVCQILPVPALSREYSKPLMAFHERGKDLLIRLATAATSSKTPRASDEACRIALSIRTRFQKPA